MYSLDELKKTIKYPTSLIVGGLDSVGIELARALLEQGGFVIMVDKVDEDFLEVIYELKEYKLFVYYDYSELLRFEDYLRRLDYVFYLSHNINSLETEISSQDFLEFSKFLDQVLVLSTKYNSKFLASTSIAAHQSLVESKIHALDLGEGDRINTVYTQAEIQRYTESLAIEYHNKSQLNTRVVRLARIIGADSYLSYHSKLGELINNALFGDEIKVQGDGLDSEYYIDLKDAVYGIIKAQFSKDTNGEIFSISYENEISILSIVYKLNELIENPKEIVFVGTDNSYRSFRLYKPAPNLMRLGWSPRVSFERALKQTIEDFKARKEIELMDSDETEESEEENPIPSKKGGITGFLSWLFFKNGSVETTENIQDPDGALAHLIEERKKSSEVRKGSILMANKKVDAKNSKQFRPRTSRWRGSIMRNFDSLMRPFETLRYITIRQFLLLLILFAVLILLYFNIFVVLVDSIKQITVIKVSDNKISEQLGQSSNLWYDYSKEYGNINQATTSINNNINYYSYLERFEFYNNFRFKIDEISKSFRQIFAGTNDLDYTLKPTREYVQAYNENVVYNQYSQSILRIDNDDLVQKELVKNSVSNQISDDGLRSLSKGIKEFENINTDNMNLYLRGFFDGFISNAKKVEGIYTNLNKVAKFLPALLGESGEKSYVVVLVDNTLYNPAGGYPVAEMFLSYTKGKLTDINLQNSETTTKFPSMDSLALQEVNSIKESPISSSDATYNDIFLMDQGDIYFATLKDYYLNEKQVQKIDGIVIVNLNFVADLLSLQEVVEVEGRVFTKENLISNLNELTTENELDLTFRKELITNIYALVMQNTFNNLNSNIFELSAIIEKGIQQKDITYSFSEDIFDNYLKVDTLADDATQGSKDFIAISVLLGNEDYKFSNGVIEVRVEVDISLDEEGLVRKTIEIENENKQPVSTIIICLPAASSNFEFLEATQLASELRINSFETCLNLKVLESENYKFSYNSPSLVDSDYSLGIRKQPGTNMKLDLEINSEFKKSSGYEELEARGEKKFGYRGDLLGDKIFLLKFQ